MIDGSDQAQAFAEKAAQSDIAVSWLPDHLRVVRETVEADVRPGPAGSVLYLLVVSYLLCAEFFARQLASVVASECRPR